MCEFNCSALHYTLCISLSTNTLNGETREVNNAERVFVGKTLLQINVIKGK